MEKPIKMSVPRSQQAAVFLLVIWKVDQEAVLSGNHIFRGCTARRRATTRANR